MGIKNKYQVFWVKSKLNRCSVGQEHEKTNYVKCENKLIFTSFPFFLLFLFYVFFYYFIFPISRISQCPNISHFLLQNLFCFFDGSFVFFFFSFLSSIFSGFQKASTAIFLKTFEIKQQWRSHWSPSPRLYSGRSNKKKP